MGWSFYQAEWPVYIPVSYTHLDVYKRQNEYGSPEDNFTAIAGFWSVYKGVEFTANDVAMMLSLIHI